MASPKCDYHVHYHADGCAHDEMTLPNIATEAIRLGLDEVCVLKHYSRELPNGGDEWVHWKRVVPEQFDAFLADIRAFQPTSPVRMLAGVETEIVDDGGTLNIPADQAAKLDALVLSVHWLPKMETITADPALIPGNIAGSAPEAAAAWRQRVAEIGPATIVRNLALAYTNAITRNDGPRVLGHMYDGLFPLRNYDVPVDDLSDDQLCDLMTPLMKACAETGTLWELMPDPVHRPGVLVHANTLGVRFTATVDTHMLQIDGWANLRDHDQAEDYLASLELTKGTLPVAR